MSSSIAKLYSDVVFKKPRLVIAGLLVVVAFFAWHAQYFRLDASADSLLLENDPDLEFSREINNRYGTSDSVTVAYTPDGDLFDPAEFQRRFATAGIFDLLEGLVGLLDRGHPFHQGKPDPRGAARDSP